MKNVNPREWTKQVNFSQDDVMSNDGPNGKLMIKQLSFMCVR
jgi:hypothetical protein